MKNGGKILVSIRIIGITVSITIIYQILSVVPSIFLSQTLFESMFPWFVGFCQIVFMLIPAIYLSKKSESGLFDTLRMNHTPTIRQFILGSLGMFSLFFFAAGWATVQESIIPKDFIDMYHSMSKSIEDSYIILLGGAGTAEYLRALLIGALIPAVCEESLYRGYLQSNLEKALKPYQAIAISGILFGLIHFNPIGMLQLVLIGLFMALSAYFSRSIALPIMLHFMNNAVVITNMFQSEKLADKTITESQLLPLDIAVIAVIGGIALIVASAYGVYKYSDFVENNDTVYE